MANAMLQQCAATRHAMSARSACLTRSVRAAGVKPVRQARGKVVVRAEAESDDFDERLNVLRGKRSKRAVTEKMDDEADATMKTKAPPSGQKKKGVRDFTVVGSIDEPNINWGPEEIMYEGPPARGEIVANLAMSWTIVWLPLTISAVGRGLWVNYKITDKRVAVLSTSPIRTERTDVPMDEIVDVVAIGRGVGLWGDMVITLKNQEKVELRSLPNFKEIEAHIRARMGQADPEYAKL